MNAEARIVSIIKLDKPEHGTCILCESKTLLTHEITNAQREWGDVCKFCAEKLRRQGIR